MKEFAICRVCLKNSYSFSNIYNDQSMDQLLVCEVLNDVCDLGIYVDDGLPESLCVDCLGKVVEFKSFKTNAHKGRFSLMLLKERMENPVIKKEELDISGDEFEEPFEGFNTELNIGPILLKHELLTVYEDRLRQELNESEESDGVHAIEPSAASMEESAQAVIKQEELDISGNEFKEPFNEVNFGPILLKDEMLVVYGDRHVQELNESEESVFVSAVEPSAAAMEDSVQNDMEPLRLESDEEDIDSTEEQFTLVEAVTHPKNLECLQHEICHCRFSGAVAHARTRDKSINDKSIFEKSRNISLDVEVEASLSGKAERLEGQGIHPRESMCMTSLLEGDVAVTKECEWEVRKTGAEGGRGSVAESVVEGERKSFKCYHCGNELMTKIGLIKHMEVHRFGTSDNCEGCGKIFPSNSKLIPHVLTSTGSKQSKCVKCCKSISQNSIHERQVESRIGSQQYKCEICSKKFKFRSYLITHMKSHTGSQPYKCIECSKCFSQNYHLVRHMRSHTGSKPYKCLECSKCFSRSSHLVTHMRSHTGSKPYKCLECSKCFSQNYHLVRHMRSHTGSKPYKCIECSKCFSQNYHLVRHMRSHSGSKPYKCMECSKWFSRMSNLVRHMKSHTGSKPYKCMECSKCFSRSSHLVTHMRSHTGSKPYKCLECSKWFSHMSNLVRHMKSHTGSKPYKCMECSKCFSRSSHLVTHMRSHTGSKPYKCLECSKCFSRSSHLLRHIRSHRI